MLRIFFNSMSSGKPAPIPVPVDYNSTGYEDRYRPRKEHRDSSYSKYPRGSPQKDYREHFHSKRDYNEGDSSQSKYRDESFSVRVEYSGELKRKFDSVKESCESMDKLIDLQQRDLDALKARQESVELTTSAQIAELPTTLEKKMQESQERFMTKQAAESKFKHFDTQIFALNSDLSKINDQTRELKKEQSTWQEKNGSQSKFHETIEDFSRQIEAMKNEIAEVSTRIPKDTDSGDLEELQEKISKTSNIMTRKFKQYQSVFQQVEEISTALKNQEEKYEALTKLFEEQRSEQKQLTDLLNELVSEQRNAHKKPKQ